MKTYPYKVAWCPFCNQGWVEILKEKETGQLFVCCDECEVEWEHPKDVVNRIKGTRFKYGQAIQPSDDDIKSVGWQQYLI